MCDGKFAPNFYQNMNGRFCYSAREALFMSVYPKSLGQMVKAAGNSITEDLETANAYQGHIWPP